MDTGVGAAGGCRARQLPERRMAVMSVDTIGGADPPGAVDSGAEPPPARHRRRWLGIVAGAAGLVVAATAITGLQLGAHYQPVGLGNSGGHVGGRIITRAVNNF